MSLSSLIVERGIASMREIEEAFARQVLYGADLVTNLFEVTPIEESVLMPLVAESFGLSAAPAGELPSVPEGAARLVTAEVVADRALVPLEMGETLVVAVAEPLSPEVEQELTFALAVRIEQRIAPLFRIRQALSRDYGLPLDRRTARLITRIAEGPSEAGKPAETLVPPEAEAPPELGASAREDVSHRPPPRPPSIAPAPRLNANEPARRDAAEGTFVRTVGAPPARMPRRRRGPLTFELATEELETSAERDSIFNVVFEFARQFFDYTAFFTVHGDLAEGRDAFGDGASRDKVARIGVPLDLGNMLTTARQQKKLLRVKASRDGLDPVLMADLGRDGKNECVVLPIIVRARVVALLFGDGGASGIDLAGLEPLERLVDGASGAFERVIVRRKLERADAPAERAPPSPKAASPVPERAPVPPKAASPVPEPVETPPPTQISRSDPPRVSAVLSTSERPPPRNVLLVRRPSGRPIPREEPDSATLLAARDTSFDDAAAGSTSTPPESPPRRRSIAIRRAQAPVLEFGTPSIPSVTTENGAYDAVIAVTPRLPTVDENLDPIRPLVVVTPDREMKPVAVPGAASFDDEPSHDPDATPIAPPVFDPDMQETPIAPPVEPVLALAQRKGAPRVLPPVSEGRSMPTSEQQVSVAAHRPPTSRSDISRALPSVIIDVASEYVGLVERVLAGPDEEAETVLLRAGAYAMPAVMTKFPGPTTVERQRLESDHLPRVAECGPILRLIASQRRTALPFVVTHLADENADARFWATYLMTELVYPDAVEPALARAFDEDGRVRHVARAALRALAVAYPQTVVDKLEVIANAGSPRRRVQAIEALGAAREALAVGALLPLLDVGSDAVTRATRASLVMLARQDFGADAKKWSAWWHENKTRHRIEWLIDALMHEKRELRAAASDELKTITKEYFAYYDDLPKRERERAQTRYREWWEEIGRVRFSRASTRGS